ncbi:HEAT repeat domain-containing protein [Candidatus Uabimicrobium sp. HlEnr_7]|uniref:HEAT repeat domain-containing protein n=1 Tax=Candidatus Uabimicrobium helgolandensis TaxID=3095367 RepID=UPI00355809ED
MRILVYTISIVALFLLGFFICLHCCYPQKCRCIVPYIKNMKKGNLKQKYCAVQKIYELRKCAKPFIEELSPILYSAEDPLIKSFLLDTFADCNYNDQRLYTFLEDHSGDVRASAIGVLAKDSNASSKICELAISDPDSFVRKVATSYLTDIVIDHKKRLDTILLKCNDEDDSVRSTAVQIFTKVELGIHYKKVINKLMYLALHDNGGTRYTAIKVLGHFSQSQTLRFIIKFLKYSDTRPYALDALATASSSSEILAFEIYQFLQKENMLHFVAKIIKKNKTQNRFLLKTVIKNIDCKQLSEEVMQALVMERRYILAYINRLLQSESDISQCLKYVQKKLQ